MTTRAPGLTAAMRRDLKLVRDGKEPLVRQNRINRLIVAGFIDLSEAVTPRGQAALAAPRMTAAELETLEGIERGSTSYQYKHQITALLFNRLRNFDWIMLFGEDDELDTPTVAITTTGLTALNNMRAAMGSAEYREDLK